MMKDRNEKQHELASTVMGRMNRIKTVLESIGLVPTTGTNPDRPGIGNMMELVSLNMLDVGYEIKSRPDDAPGSRYYLKVMAKSYVCIEQIINLMESVGMLVEGVQNEKNVGHYLYDSKAMLENMMLMELGMQDAADKALDDMRQCVDTSVSSMMPIEFWKNIERVTEHVTDLVLTRAEALGYGLDAEGSGI